MVCKVYLSGKMGGRPGDEVMKERLHAAALCIEAGLQPFDPAIGENIPVGDDHIDMGISPSVMQSFVCKDEYNLDACDVCLVLTGDTPSDGTWWEMARAYYILHIPIVMVAPKRMTGQVMGFSNFKVGAIFPTMEEAITYIATHLANGRRSNALHY